MANHDVWKALADPTRREILRQLRSGSQTAGALAERFPMTKGTLSHHFSVLKSADLITAERRGQQIVYALNTTVFEDVATVLLDLFGAKSTLEAKTQESAEPGADGGTQDAIPESKRR